MKSRCNRNPKALIAWACFLAFGCQEKSALTPQPSSSEPTLPPSVTSKTPSPKTVISQVQSPSPPTSTHLDSLPPEVDLGTPAPVVLGQDVMVAKDKKDDLIVSRLKDGQFENISTPWDQVSAWPISLTSGPSHRAYWVSQGRLVQRQIDADGSVGPLKVIATDAAHGSPISAARALGHVNQDVVLYAGYKKDKSQWSGRLWVEGHGSRPVSLDASSVTSLALVHLGLARFALLMLDGRLGMSPVHAQSLEFDMDGVPQLGENQVVYVAGPAERGTALTGILVGRGPVALLPISKDVREFGLLMLRIGYGDGEAPSLWVDYPNGLDPAPLAAATICGKPMIAFVRPAEPTPGSPRVVELTELDGQAQLQNRKVVAAAANIAHVALGGDAHKGWVVYATEKGLRGQRIECK